MGTVLLCAVDPADRAIARTTFVDRTWYVLEASPEDLPKVVGAVQLDAVVVIGNADTHGAAVKLITAESRLSVRKILRVLPDRRVRRPGSGLGNHAQPVAEPLA